MISVRNLILYSTVPALFSSALFVVVGGISVQLFYFLMIFNLALMVYLGRIWVPTGLVILLGFVLISGIVGIARSLDTVPLFLKEFSGIAVSALYFCCFLQLMEYDVSRCFRLYAQTAYYIAVIGLIVFPIQFVYFHLPRLQSVLSEPAMFAMTCLPALYHFADRWQRYRRDGRKFLVMALAFALAGSSVGFLGVIFGASVFGRRYKLGAIVIPVAASVLGVGIYMISPDFRMRVDDTTKSGQTLDVGDANISTLALLSNAYVTFQSVKEHPLLGTGIGSHRLSHEKFISAVPGVEQWVNTDALEIAASDANSLFLRLLSECGLAGLVAVLWFVWNYRVRQEDEIEGISQAIWIYFFVKLLRGGAYFSPEQFFFIVLYAVNHRQSRTRELSSEISPGYAV